MCQLYEDGFIVNLRTGLDVYPLGIGQAIPSSTLSTKPTLIETESSSLSLSLSSNPSQVLCRNWPTSSVIGKQLAEVKISQVGWLETYNSLPTKSTVCRFDLDGPKFVCLVWPSAITTPLGESNFLNFREASIVTLKRSARQPQDRN